MKRKTGIILLVLLLLGMGVVVYDVVEIQSSSEYFADHIESPVTGTLLVSPYGARNDLVTLLAQTKYDLDMWMYMISYDEAMTLLANLADMGVDVNIIGEEYPFGGRNTQFDKLTNKLQPHGGELVGDDALGINFNHTKTFILDESSFIISTANLSYTSMRANREYWFVSRHPGILASLNTIFAKDWRGSTLLRRDIHPQLLVCPVDCRDKLFSALQDAEESIWIATQYIQDEELIALLDKKSETMDVRLLVGDNQDPGRIDHYGTGLKYLGDPYLHAKNILIDDQVLIMGSMNLSTNAMDNNREISIAINDPAVISKFRRQFLDDRELATYKP